MQIHSFPKVILFLAASSLLSACSMLPDWIGEKEEAPLPGNRVSVLSDRPVLKADSGVADVSVRIPEPGVASPWAQSPGNAEQAMGNLFVQQDGGSTSERTVGDGNNWPTTLVPPPVSDDARIYALDARGYVSAHKLDAIDTVVWEGKVFGEKKQLPMPGGGLAVSQGKVFAITGAGEVALFEAETGKVLWQRSLNQPVRSTPRVEEGRAYVVTLDNQLLAMDISDGKVLWRHSGLTESAGVLGAATPAFADGKVIAAYSSGELIALDAASGREEWAESLASVGRTSQTAALSDVDANPVVSEGRLYAGGHGGSLLAIDLATGRQVWEREISTTSTPWVAGDFMYLLTTDNQLTCLQKSDGQVKWVVLLPTFEDEKKQKTRITWSGPVMAGGLLWLVGDHGILLKLQPAEGQLLRSISIPSGVNTEPVIAMGRAFFVTHKAGLIALR